MICSKLILFFRLVKWTWVIRCCGLDHVSQHTVWHSGWKSLHHRTTMLCKKQLFFTEKCVYMNLTNKKYTVDGWAKVLSLPALINHKPLLWLGPHSYLCVTWETPQLQKHWLGALWLINWSGHSWPFAAFNGGTMPQLSFVRHSSDMCPLWHNLCHKVYE